MEYKSVSLTCDIQSIINRAKKGRILKVYHGIIDNFFINLSAVIENKVDLQKFAELYCLKEKEIKCKSK